MQCPTMKTPSAIDFGAGFAVSSVPHLTYTASAIPMAAAAKSQQREEIMKPTACVPAARLALALGLIAGAWLMPLESTAGIESYLPADDANVATGPERIHLAQAGTVPVERPVSYSSDQADRGKERYKRDCEECHGDDLKGGLNGGAPLRGLAFEQKYGEGLPASVMYAFMSSTMPPNAPGRYSPSTYADLMAYILKRNGFREGSPLPSDFDALDSLIMDK